ncbi:hypothetical protein B484DRAFT_414739 [Ochromonadaceae sp. CCMP2298]|nr:hypothetical protein B484DRAFT_414739 [Ochromonadaceae sp. CCMP2298]
MQLWMQLRSSQGLKPIPVKPKLKLTAALPPKHAPNKHNKHNKNKKAKAEDKKQPQCLPKSPPSPLLQSAFVLDRLREFLGNSCDAQLRLLCRWSRDTLKPLPRTPLQVDDYLSSVVLFKWARGIKMPRGQEVVLRAAEGGNLEVLHDM